MGPHTLTEKQPSQRHLQGLNSFPCTERLKQLEKVKKVVRQNIGNHQRSLSTTNSASRGSVEVVSEAPQVFHKCWHA